MVLKLFQSRDKHGKAAIYFKLCNVNTNSVPGALNPQPESKYPMWSSISVSESPIWHLVLLLKVSLNQRCLFDFFKKIRLTILVFKKTWSIYIYCNYLFLPPYFVLSMCINFLFLLAFFLELSIFPLIVFFSFIYFSLFSN